MQILIRKMAQLSLFLNLKNIINCIDNTIYLII